MKIIKGCLLKAASSGEVNCIIHQVNMRGVMGSGIAAQIRKLYPSHYDRYMREFAVHNLGDAFTSYEPDGLAVSGIFSQRDYGTGRTYTNYAALVRGLIIVVRCHPGRVFGLPYGIGCGLGGGDWSIVSKLIEDVEAVTGVEFKVYKHD